MHLHHSLLTSWCTAAVLAAAACGVGAAPVSGAAAATTEAAPAAERALAASDVAARDAGAAGRALGEAGVGRTSTGNRNLDLLLELQQLKEGPAPASAPGGRAGAAGASDAARSRAQPGAQAMPEDEEIRTHSGRPDPSEADGAKSRKWVSEVGGGGAAFAGSGRGGESSSGGSAGDGYVDPYDYSFLKRLIPRWLYVSLRENRDLVIGVGLAVVVVSAWVSSRITRRRAKRTRR